MNLKSIQKTLKTVFDALIPTYTPPPSEGVESPHDSEDINDYFASNHSDEREDGDSPPDAGYSLEGLSIRLSFIDREQLTPDKLVALESYISRLPEVDSVLFLDVGVKVNLDPEIETLSECRTAAESVAKFTMLEYLASKEIQ